MSRQYVGHQAKSPDKNFLRTQQVKKVYSSLRCAENYALTHYRYQEAIMDASWPKKANVSQLSNFDDLTVTDVTKASTVSKIKKQSLMIYNVIMLEILFRKKNVC